jgi:hypothetical protein
MLRRNNDHRDLYATELPACSRRMALKMERYSIGVVQNEAGVVPMPWPLYGVLTLAETAASRIDVLEVYNNNCLTSSNCNNDTDSDFNSAMSNMDGDTIRELLTTSRHHPRTVVGPSHRS